MRMLWENDVKKASVLLQVVTLAAVACWGRPALSADIPDADKKAAEKMASEVCAQCHGPGGRSIAPTFPQLAGQPAPYLETQLKAFRDQTRSDPDAIAYMWGMAAQLNDATIAALADYYSRQKPAVPAKLSDPAAAADGKRIFEQGVPAGQIPACASCHGAQAQGNGVIPRLAGQHAGYLRKQILVIQNALRSAPVMHGVVKDLTPAQTQAVALYLESL